MIGVSISGVRRVAGGLANSQTDTSNLTTFTFTLLAPARTVTTQYVLCLAWDGANNRALSSSSIAGVAGVVRQSDGNVNQRCYIVDAPVPAGAAADVSITLAGNLGLGGVMLAALFDVGTGVYRAGDTDISASGATALSLAVYNGEYVVGIAEAYDNFGAGAFSWTGLSELVDIDLRDSRVSAAAFAMLADATLSVTTSVGVADRSVLAVAAYAPP